MFSTASSPVAYYLPGTTGWGATLGDIRAMLWNPSVPFNFTTNNGIITITGYLGPSGPATIPSTINGLPVTSIGIQAFAGDLRLTSITLPGSVTSIGSFAFLYCYSLKGVFLTGNAPSVAWDAFAATGAIVYYLPGTTGWDTTFAGRPTRLWNPLMQTSGPNFGVRPAGFGFNITGTADIPIVVEACTSLGNASWVPLQSLNLTNGTVYFSDLNWTNFPARFYRIRPPLY